MHFSGIWCCSIWNAKVLFRTECAIHSHNLSLSFTEAAVPIQTPHLRSHSWQGESNALCCCPYRHPGTDSTHNCFMLLQSNSPRKATALLIWRTALSGKKPHHNLTFQQYHWFSGLIFPGNSSGTETLVRGITLPWKGGRAGSQEMLLLGSAQFSAWASPLTSSSCVLLTLWYQFLSLLCCLSLWAGMELCLLHNSVKAQNGLFSPEKRWQDANDPHPHAKPVCNWTC